ncbi:hypothetical protein Tco_1251894, partial [Tanacetum coccineum]
MIISPFFLAKSRINTRQPWRKPTSLLHFPPTNTLPMLVEAHSTNIEALMGRHHNKIGKTPVPLSLKYQELHFHFHGITHRESLTAIPYPPSRVICLSTTRKEDNSLQKGSHNQVIRPSAEQQSS